MATPRQPTTAGEDAGGDTDMQPASSPPRPGPLLRPTSWAADGPPGVTGQIVQTQYIKGASLDRAGMTNAPPSGSSSATATPAHSNGEARFADPDEDLELDTPENATPGPLRAGHARTAADRSSGSSGSGDSVLVKPLPKRARHPDASSTSASTAHKLDDVPPRNLYGSLHVPAVRVIAPESDFGLWFLFTVSLASRSGPCVMLCE